jgi:hypothetical protein
LVAFGFSAPLLDHKTLLRTKRCHSPGKKNDTRDPRKPRATRGELLQEDDSRETCDPKHIHEAANEKQRHQHPTAAHAKGSMLHPHSYSPKPAGSPVKREKFHRIAAMI